MGVIQFFVACANNGKLNTNSLLDVLTTDICLCLIKVVVIDTSVIHPCVCIAHPTA